MRENHIARLAELESDLEAILLVDRYTPLALDSARTTPERYMIDGEGMDERSKNASRSLVSRQPEKRLSSESALYQAHDHISSS